ncbi:hypothetical protein [Salmonella enterica]|uniref:hypothetical protein n=1 Tax=Salmonella enterica TaxID=28901 RepID=UPI0015C359FB
MRRLSRSVTPTASVHYVWMSVSSPILPVTSARAAPLIADFGGLVVLTLRNHLRFTRVHNDSCAQKSPERF